MEQEIYADLYFLINFGMDTVCLMITAALLHCRVRRWRVILAASCGGLYSLASLLLGLGGPLGLLLDCVAALGICALAYAEKKGRLRRLLQITGVQFLTSMLLGGVMTVLYTFLNRLHLPLDTLQGDGLSVWTFALVTAVASVTTLRGGKWMGLSAKSEYVTVTAVLFDRQITLRALVDSGNLLRDPVSGKSVIVANREKLLPLLPPALQRADASRDWSPLLSDYELARHIRLIPTETATGKGLLPAILPQALTLTRGKESFTADYLIAVTDLGTAGKKFDAVISLH